MYAKNCFTFSENKYQPLLTCKHNNIVHDDNIIVTLLSLTIFAFLAFYDIGYGKIPASC